MAKREEQRRRLFRSSTDRYIAGVLGGFGQYFHIKSSVLRVIYVSLTAISGIFPGVLIYFMMALIIPPDPHDNGVFGILTRLFNQGNNPFNRRPQRKQLHDVHEEDVDEKRVDHK
ncbi:MAG: PspC domain-containing protein [[Lactobacillus] timonensis]|jgi:phage shock protein C|uniref:PspC domain-containing protein n=1 Tax=[Lactobacillus] timonensis TaxID=1970790 RepID=UPI0023576CEC|nr:PspC domain-containing protein [[Lactobacillus] timonensis]MCI1926227.1 PspC domain-containing protein [[Lactobacillus] timonensis]MCI1957574.1 PspC domain-containing protein [[Lactobacillus] timonensis]MCI1970622.1 PspC domain-containing protein [[Lactobacillus] timonensis]MCI2006782.1 PspC domain-containing protein [[Lactobacillus] timonensis]